MPEPRRIEYLPLDDVQPAERNPKQHAVRDVMESIRRFGWTAPVILDERTGRLVAGHGRLTALRAIRDENLPVPDGVQTTGTDWLVPVVRGWRSADEAHATAALIADNKLSENGGWDDRALAELLDELGDYSPDLMAATGYSEHELKAMVDAFAGFPDMDDLADDVGEPTESDGHVRVAFKVPKEIATLWRQATDATGLGDETQAATAAVRAAHRALLGDSDDA